MAAVVWAGSICGLFLVIDLGFFGANARKLADGGWYPLAHRAGILAVMHTWKTGRNVVFERVYGGNVTEEELTTIARSQVRRPRVRAPRSSWSARPEGHAPRPPPPREGEPLPAQDGRAPQHRDSRTGRPWTRPTA
jgi:hypothetical protein